MQVPYKSTDIIHLSSIQLEKQNPNVRNITWFIVIRWNYNYILMCLLIKMLKILIQQTTVMNRIAKHATPIMKLIPTQDILIFIHIRIFQLIFNIHRFFFFFFEYRFTYERKLFSFFLHYNTFHSLILKLYQKGWSNWSQNVIFIFERVFFKKNGFLLEPNRCYNCRQCMLHVYVRIHMPKQ